MWWREGIERETRREGGREGEAGHQYDALYMLQRSDEITAHLLTIQLIDELKNLVIKRERFSYQRGGGGGFALRSVGVPQ